MQNLSPAPEKINSSLPFRTWDGHLVVAAPCGGWRRVRPLDLAVMLPTSRRLILFRDMED